MRSVVSDQILTGELSGVDLAGALRQGVKRLFLIWTIIYVLQL